MAMLDTDAPNGPESGTEVDDATLAVWFDRDLAAISGAGLAPEDFDRLFAVFRRNYRALLAYAPRPYAGPVTLFVAAEGYGPAGAAPWSALAPAAEVVEVGGPLHPARSAAPRTAPRPSSRGASTEKGAGVEIEDFAPWSPAPRAASAAASRSGSPRPAPRSSPATSIAPACAS